MATTKTKRRRRRISAKKSKGFTGQQFVRDLEMPVTVAIGVFAGKIVHDLLTRGTEMSGIGDTEDGKKGASLLIPAALLAGGIALPQFTGNRYAKPVGAGVAIYGGVTAAKNYTGADVLGSLNPDKRYSLPILGLGNASLANPRKLHRATLPPPATMRRPLEGDASGAPVGATRQGRYGTMML